MSDAQLYGDEQAGLAESGRLTSMCLLVQAIPPQRLSLAADLGPYKQLSGGSGAWLRG